MNSYKKLMNNSIVFAVGSLGSKLINLILVPIYTYYLTTSQYGSVDVLITTVSMLIPIVSFSMYDAALRFVMNNQSKQTEILSNAFFISIVGVIISLFFYPLLELFGILPEYLPYLYLILIFQIFERILAQYARGIGMVKVFAINGILLTLSTGILNVLFLVVFKLEVLGYLISLVLSYIISIVYLLYSSKAYKKLKIYSVNKSTSNMLLKYSLPLIPNALIWWIINASSRYFILYFVGLSANGLFAVASRIPTLINLISQVFSQAWQLSAIEEVEKNNNSNFYSKVLNNFISVMFLIASVILVVIKPLLFYVFSIDYFEAWKVVPFLLLGVIFSSFSSFLGAVYIATKETKGIFNTSVFGGLVGLLLNIVLIPLLGIVGAGVSSMFSFLVMFILRYKGVKKYVLIKLDKTLFIWSITILLIQSSILFFDFNLSLEFGIALIFFVILIIINRDLIILMYRLVITEIQNFISNYIKK